MPRVPLVLPARVRTSETPCTTDATLVGEPFRPAFFQGVTPPTPRAGGCGTRSAGSRGGRRGGHRGRGGVTPWAGNHRRTGDQLPACHSATCSPVSAQPSSENSRSHQRVGNPDPASRRAAAPYRRRLPRDRTASRRAGSRARDGHQEVVVRGPQRRAAASASANSSRAHRAAAHRPRSGQPGHNSAMLIRVPNRSITRCASSSAD